MGPVANAQSTVDALVAAIVFEGVTVFHHDSLLPLYEDNLGRRLNSDEKALLERKIVSLYVQRGYLEPVVGITHHLDVPGIVMVRVTEPRIDDVGITGVEGERAQSVRDAVEPLMQAQPISQRAIDGLVRDIEQSQGLALKTSLTRSSSGSPNYFLLVDVTTRVEGELTYSAEGGQLLGRHLTLGKITVYNPLSWIQEVSVLALHTLESDGYRNAAVGTVLPISDRDALHLSTSFARAIPQDPQSDSDTIYRRQLHQMIWVRELLNQHNLEVSLNSGLTIRDYTQNEDNINEADERLRMGDVGVRALVRGDQRISRFGLSSRLGFDALGALRRGTQADGTTDLSFQVFAAEYTLWQGLPSGLSFRADLAAQYSRDNLPFSQRFSIGGSRFARAYEPGEFSGDTGIGSKLELRRGFRFDALPGAQWVPYVYYGLATAYENEDEERVSAAAGGIGLRVLADRFSAYAEYGVPLTVDSQYRENAARLTGRVTVTF